MLRCPTLQILILLTLCLFFNTTRAYTQTLENLTTLERVTFNYTYFAKYYDFGGITILQENNECGKQMPCSMQNLLRVAAMQINQDVKNLNVKQYARFDINIVLMNNFTENQANCGLPFDIDDSQIDVAIYFNFQSEKVDRMNYYTCGRRKELILSNLYNVGLENVEMNFIQAPFYKIQNSRVKNCLVNPTFALSVSNSVLSDVEVYASITVHIHNSQLIYVGLTIESADIVEIVNTSMVVEAHNKFDINNVQLFNMSRVEFSIGLHWKMNLRSIQQFNFIDSYIGFSEHAISTDYFVFDLEIVFTVILKGLKVKDMGGNAFTIRYSSSISLKDLEMVENRCGVGQKSLIHISHASSVELLNSNFKDNGCSAIFVENVKSLSCGSSTFINNGKTTNGGAISGTGIQILDIVSSSFIANKAIGGSGGALYFNNIGVGGIHKCLLEKNRASVSGGALFYRGGTEYVSGLIINECIFIENSLDSMSNSTISTEFVDCKGTGGAFSVKQLGFLGSTVISGNRATWGGGGFYFSTSFHVENTTIIDNIASFAGAGLFVTSHVDTLNFLNNITIHGNQASVYGNSFASPIKSILDFEITFFDIDGKISSVVKNPKSIQVFFGQRMDLKFLQMADVLGNEFALMQERIQIFDFFYDFEITKFALPNGIGLQIRKRFRDIPHRDSLTLSLITESLSIDLVFRDCPSGYELGESECVKSFPTAMVVSLSILGLLIAVIVGGVFGFLFSKIVKKISYMRARVSILTKREQADEDIGRKLLESPFQSYGEEVHTRDSMSLSADFSVNNTPRTKLKKISKFIINSEDLTFSKKIAEGGFGSVYLAKWNVSTDVAVKSFHQNSENTDEEEFEKEVALLVNLRNPHIVSFYGICITETKKFMVVEYMDKGSLDKIIYESKCGRENISFKQKLRILIDVARYVSNF